MPLLIESSLSSTYGPVIAEAKRANVPLWFAGAVCPKETHPPKPDPVLFCSTGFDFSYDIPVAIEAIKDVAKEPVKIGLVGMPVPISRIGIDNAEKQGAKLGMTTTDKEFIPPTAADYTPFATKLKAGEPNWGFAYAPWPTEVKTFEALRRLGWTGSYMTYGHIQSEDELARVKDGGFHVFSANAFFQDNLPVQKEIRDVAEKGKYSYPATYATEGWITGRALEQILKATGWPATPEKVRNAMDTLNLDTQGLRGGALRLDAGQPFPHQAVLSLLSLRSGQTSPSCASATGSRSTSSTESFALAGATILSRRQLMTSTCRSNSSPTSLSSRRSTRS